MRATAALVLVLPLLAACASTPSTDARASLPERVQPQRPEGTVPDGLADVRDSIGEQRSEARERENALSVLPNELTTMPTGTPWYESALGVVGHTIDAALGWVWIF